MACNPSTGEVEAGEWRVRGQPGLHREALPQNTKGYDVCGSGVAFA
jgi:hypothetical protein